MCCAFVAIYRYNRDVRMTKNKVTLVWYDMYHAQYFVTALRRIFDEGSRNWWEY